MRAVHNDQAGMSRSRRIFFVRGTARPLTRPGQCRTTTIIATSCANVCLSFNRLIIPCFFLLGVFLRQNYFGDAWNVFDFIIVLGSFIDIIYTEVNVSISCIGASTNFRLRFLQFSFYCISFHQFVALMYAAKAWKEAALIWYKMKMVVGRVEVFFSFLFVQKNSHRSKIVV